MQEKLLSHEETLDCLRRAKEGDAAAKELLVEKNLALVKSIVKKFIGRGVEFDDLMQIGCMGLIKAIGNYSFDYDVRFSTYAVPMIAGEIKRFLRDDGIIKVSRSLKEQATAIFHANEILKNKLKRDPTLEELSAETGIDVEDIAVATEAVRAPVSIYEPAYDDDSKKTLLLDTLPVDSENMIDNIALKELLSRLSPEERKLIFLRFFRDKTQTEIARMLGISQVQVSRLIQKTLKKIKQEAE